MTTPRRLIKAAADLVPQWRPQQLTLSFFDDSHGKPAHANLSLGFGRDANGESTHVHVALELRDVSIILAYMLAHDMMTAVTAFGELRGDGEDDGGEELSLPTISAGALAKMQPHGAVQ